MLINFKKVVVLCVIYLTFTPNSYGQIVWENNNASIYNYLDRMSQKGIIEYNSIIQPQSRSLIDSALKQILTKEILLSKIEKDELHYFLKEYDLKIVDKEVVTLFKKDENQRWRLLNIINKEFSIKADPLLGYKNYVFGDNNIRQLSNGFQLFGTIGNKRKWGFQVYYRDYTENGNVLLNDRNNNNEKGIVIIGDKTQNKINFSTINANLSYQFNKGTISIGSEPINWGIGENGKIVLSEKAPNYPYVRLDYKPTKWLSFNYFNAWLNSNIIDSNHNYSTYTNNVMGDIRYFYIPKYLASHSLIITPSIGLDIALGESIVYSDRMDPGFLLPINLFKIYDNNRSNYLINAGSNGQYFLQLNSRNQLKNTHMYFSMFIDEIKVSSIFDKQKSRNQLGYTIGGNITDIFINYLTIGTEYTRINPFVYTNLIPAQYYTQYEYKLGDWMGSNADRLIFFAKYTPIANCKIYTRYQITRKGDEGTIYQQYLVQPQPKFLFNQNERIESLFLKLTYEFNNNIFLNMSFENSSATHKELKNNTKQIQMGITLGL
jgi:hypothetical protein